MKLLSFISIILKSIYAVFRITKDYLRFIAMGLSGFRMIIRLVDRLSSCPASGGQHLNYR